MNIESFHHWLEEPGNLERDSLPLLEEFVSEYPYCQSARTLFLLILRKENDYRSNRQLGITAVYAPDRSRLRHLMNTLGDTRAVVTKEMPIQEKTQTDRGITRKIKDEEVKKIKDIERKIHDSLTEIEERRNKLRLLLEEKKAMLAREKELESILEEDLPAPALPKDELLEDFLKQQGKPEKGTFFNPVEKARKSLEDEGQVTSETLARLLISQGKIQKAIKIYQQLLLNIPEKSGYFAAQIKDLKKKIKE
jgi:hypothetical protein